MRYMNDVYLDGYIKGYFKINEKKCIFTLHNPIKNLDILCKGKYKQIKSIPSKYLVGIKGSIEGERIFKVVNVDKIKIYGVEE